MEFAGISRLKEEQNKALAATESQLLQWEKFEADYINLQKKISSLPQEITRPHLVPFGPLAFMPGQLIHTNEIMVLLGDNWFAEMSAKRACEVIDRRLNDVKTNLDKLKAQKKLLETRSSFTANEFGSHDEVDIREDYDSDTERTWQVKHKENAKKNKLKEKKGTCLTDDDVFSRLESLQLQELKGREMARLESNEDDEYNRSESKDNGSKSTYITETMKELDSSSEKANSCSNKKNVKWKDQNPVDIRLKLPDVKDEDLSSLDSDDSLDQSPVIYFKHSPRSDDEKDTPGATSNSHITSPRDIYRLYMKPKSILKAPSSEVTCTGGAARIKSQVKIEESCGNKTESASFSLTQTAIQEHVVEKKTAVTLNLEEEKQQLPEQKQQPPRVSKFKAMRQQRSS